MKLDNDLKIRINDIATDDFDSLDMAASTGFIIGVLYTTIGIGSIIAVGYLTTVICEKIDNVKRKNKKL